MNTYEKFLAKQYNVRSLRDFRDLVYTAASEYKSRPAFSLRGRDISFVELKEDYRALCTAFLDKGYADKKIAVVGSNRYEWTLTYAAAATVGVAVPIDKELTAEDMDNFIDTADCVAVVGDAKILKKIQLGKEIDNYAVEADAEGDTLPQLVEEGRGLYEGGMTDIDVMDKFLSLTDHIVREIPIFEMECLPNEEAAVLSSTTMCRASQEENL